MILQNEYSYTVLGSLSLLCSCDHCKFLCSLPEKKIIFHGYNERIVTIILRNFCPTVLSQTGTSDFLSSGNDLCNVFWTFDYFYHEPSLIPAELQIFKSCHQKYEPTLSTPVVLNKTATLLNTK